MTRITTKPDSSQPQSDTDHLFDDWFDPIEAGVRDRVRDFIQAMIEGELDTALSRPRYARHAKPPSGEAQRAVGATGHRHGHRSRSLLGSFGQVEIEVPRARLNTPDGKTTEWKSKALRAYQCKNAPNSDPAPDARYELKSLGKSRMRWVTFRAERDPTKVRECFVLSMRCTTS